MIPEIATCPYRGDLALGLIIGVPGREPLCITSAEAVALLSALNRYQILLHPNMSPAAMEAILDCGKISGSDQSMWSPRSNLHFSNCAEKVLGWPLAASDAVCLQGVLYGEGALADFVESPTARKVLQLSRLLGETVVVERRRHIMVGVVRRVAIGRLRVHVDFEKQIVPGFDPEDFFDGVERVLWNDLTLHLGERSEGGFGVADEHNWTFLNGEKVIEAMVGEATACTDKISLLRLFRRYQNSHSEPFVEIEEG